LELFFISDQNFLPILSGVISDYLSFGTTLAGRPWPRAVAYGFLRLFMGLFFGVLIWLLSTTLMTRLGYGFSQNLLTYLLVYVSGALD